MFLKSRFNTKKRLFIKSLAIPKNLTYCVCLCVRHCPLSMVGGPAQEHTQAREIIHKRGKLYTGAGIYTQAREFNAYCNVIG